MASAQRSNQHSAWITQYNQPISLDSLTVVPGSIFISDTISFDHDYDEATGLITITTLKKDPPDSVRLLYTVFPYDFRQNFARRDQSLIDSSGTYDNTLIYMTDPLNKREELFVTDNLYKSGALSRGISF